MFKSGCEIWGNCETCTYSDCIAGTGGKSVTLLKRAEAIKLSQQGKNVEQIALEVGRSRWQVKRYLAEVV